jgi:hypothetical protein
VSTKACFRLVALVAFYSIVLVALTYPLVLHPRTHFVIDGPDARAMGDPAMFIWNIDHFTSAVRARSNPFFTDRILHPIGANLWFHTYTAISGALGALLGNANAITTLNVMVFSSFLLSALGSYAMSKKFVDDRRLAALAGVAFSFCPYKLAHLIGHHNLLLTATIPAFAVCIVSYCQVSALGVERDPSRIRLRRGAWALGALGLLVVTAFSDYYYAYFLLWFAFVYLGYWRYEPRICAALPVFKRWSLPVIVLSTAVTLVCTQWFRLETNGAFGYSADLFGYIVPSKTQLVLGGTALAALRRTLRIDGIEHETYVGLVLLGPFCLFLTSRCHREAGRPLRALLFCGACFIVLSMPAVRVAGAQLFCFPTAALHLLPFINHVRVPARFNVMVMLIMPIVAMIAVERRIFPSLTPGNRSLAIGLLLLGLLADFKRVPYFTASLDEIPAVYRVLAERPAGTLLEIPFGIRDGRQAIGNERTASMWFQTVHHKNLIGGMVARLPDSTFDWFRQTPVLSEILALEEYPLHVPLASTRNEVAAFIGRFGIAYVLIAPEYRGSRLEKYVNDSIESFVLSREEFDGFALLTVRQTGP